VVAGYLVLAVASVLALFKLRIGVVIALVGECLCWRYFGPRAIEFPWRRATAVLYSVIWAWPQVIAVAGLLIATIFSLFPLRAARPSSLRLKHLKILLPAIQVLLIGAFDACFHKLPWELWDLRRAILNISYPVCVAWLGVAIALDWLSQFLPSLPQSSALITAVLGFSLFFFSVGYFWYFMASEMELRRQGRSRLRFAGAVKQSTAIGGLLLFGIGALLLAFNTRYNPIALGRRRATPSEVAIPFLNLYIQRLILIVWGLIFMRLAIYEVMTLVRNKSNTALAPTSSLGDPSG